MEDQMERRSGLAFTPRLVLGLCIAAVGGLLLLDNRGILEADRFFRFWPLVLIVLGGWKVLHKQGTAVGLILAGAGTWFLLENLGWAHVDRGLVFAGVILLVGLSLLWKELTWRSRIGVGTSSRDEVHALAMMGGIGHVLTSQAFRGGSASAIMGGVEIDLRQAAPAGGQAEIDTFAWWGGVEILVPEDWEVVLRGVPIMGAFEDFTQHPVAENPPQLVIKGLVIMGGVEIRNSPKGKG